MDGGFFCHSVQFNLIANCKFLSGTAKQLQYQYQEESKDISDFTCIEYFYLEEPNRVDASIQTS